MAARKPKDPWTPEVVRRRIRTAHLIRGMQRCFDGEQELTSTQLKAGEILLRKSLPDQTHVEHSGNVTSRAEDLDDATLASIALGGSDRVVEAEGSEALPDGVH